MGPLALGSPAVAAAAGKYIGERERERDRERERGRAPSTFRQDGPGRKAAGLKEAVTAATFLRPFPARPDPERSWSGRAASDEKQLWCGVVSRSRSFVATRRMELKLWGG